MLRLLCTVALAILTLDAVVFSVFFKSFLGAAFIGLFVALACIVSVFGTKKRQRSGAKDGWGLGQGVEITNPDKPTKRTVVLPQNAMDLGMLMIGAPGGGKSESGSLGYLDYLYCTHPEDGWSYFEGKGDVDLLFKLQAAGAPIDYLFSTELEQSASINLMTGEATDVIERLREMLVMATAGTTYYSDQQTALLRMVVPIMLGIGLPCNLRDLFAVLTVPAAATRLMRMAEKHGVPRADIEIARNWFGMDDDARLGNISGLINRLYIFVHGQQTDRLNAYAPDIDIDACIDQGKRVYFHMPLSNYTRDVAIAIMGMHAVKARRRQIAGPQHVSPYRIIKDDWGSFIYEGFSPYTARCRSAKMPLVFSFQSLGQLDEVSPTFKAIVDDNIATKIMLRINGDYTGTYAQRLLGTYEQMQVSTSELSGRDGTAFGVQEKPRVSLSDLRSLSPGECYISTIDSDGQKTTNPLYKVRFPLPNFNGWENQSLPDTRTRQCAEGLHLWDNFVDPDGVEQMHKDSQHTAVDMVRDVMAAEGL